MRELMFRDAEDPNASGGNDTTTNVTEMQVEGEIVKIHTKGEGDARSVEKIEYPVSRKDDAEWQSKAKNAINITSLKYKANFDNKQQLEQIKQNQAALEKSKQELSSMLGTPSENDFDVQAAIMKELGIESQEDLADVDKEDLKKATTKVSKQLSDHVLKQSRSAAMSQELINKIMVENSPTDISAFAKWSKSLGVNTITPQMYDTWKASKPKGEAAAGNDLEVLSNIQADNIPFIPVGSQAGAPSGDAEIHKANFSVFQKHLGNL